ncbi:5,10-methylenetetrahydrofolate reductase [Saccharopolyspora sp. NPDC049357]|uniref:5,10-methylenetetrahydrofolate reductase n=1 Tax=Saccharopolyspora sp. NPDC049357 TaxID=3154507 RepID=UPI00343C97DB
MTTQQEIAGPRSGLAALVRNISYEVMPFKSTEQAVVESVPSSVPLTVTATEAKGIDATLGLAERLLARGYRVAPHLPARQFVDRGHVSDVLDRLTAAGADSAFVIGGDAPRPAGKFPDAHSLLEVMAEIGHPFSEVGIGGYPEGHGSIPRPVIDEALRRKTPLATRVITQICFDAATTRDWASEVDLPVAVGMPGPVSRQKLVRISAGIGLGRSARFLQKQQGLLWRLLLPGRYDPTRLARRLGAVAPGTKLRGLHIFTFNELAGTERWRRRLLDSLAEGEAR